MEALSLFPDKEADYKRMSKELTIPQYKKAVRDRNGRFDFDKLLDAEVRTQNRQGIVKWLKAIIDGEITYKEELMGYREILGIWKSAMQKYIRRSMTEEAVRAAQKVKWMNGGSLVQRLKIIAAEDAFEGIAELPLVETDPVKFAGVLADNPSNKDCDYGLHVLDEYEVHSLEDLREDPQMGHWLNFWRAAYNKFQTTGDLPNWLVGNDISMILLDRCQQGTYFDGDIKVMISAILKIFRGEYREDPIVPEIEEEWRNGPQGKIHWWCLDPHTAVGRNVKRRLTKRGSVNSDKLGSAWFHFSGVKTDGLAGEFEESIISDDPQKLEEVTKIWEECKPYLKKGIKLEAKKTELEVIDD